MSRDKNGRFTPGATGNPGGRPAVVEEVRRMASEASAAAVATLIKLLDAEDEKVRVAAANSLLDRAVGRPAMAISATVTAQTAAPPLDLSMLTDDELKTMAKIMAKTQPSPADTTPLVLAASADASHGVAVDEDTSDGEDES